MKKILSLLIPVVLFASCAAPRIMPRAVNTINTAPLGDLNLRRGDYEILNTITAEATVVARKTKKEIRVYEQNNEFSLGVKFGMKSARFGAPDGEFTGIVKLGYFANDYNAADLRQLVLDPESVARRLAIYRAINIAKEHGADAFVEPTISTNIEQVNKHEVVYKTTVTAKIVKLKTDR